MIKNRGLHSCMTESTGQSSDYLTLIMHDEFVFLHATANSDRYPTSSCQEFESMNVSQWYAYHCGTTIGHSRPTRLEQTLRGHAHDPMPMISALFKLCRTLV